MDTISLIVKMLERIKNPSTLMQIYKFVLRLAREEGA